MEIEVESKELQKNRIAELVFSGKKQEAENQLNELIFLGLKKRPTKSRPFLSFIQTIFSSV